MNFLGRTLAVIAAIGATVASVWAAPQQYALTVQNIRAGIVILDTAKPSAAAFYGRSAAPFALYNLDNAVGVKPIGWNIYNPHSTGVVTPLVADRWSTIEGGAADIPVVGAPISKKNAEYWSVYLSQVSDAELSDYDFLVLNPAYNASLNATERAKLIKFVDQGGVLWIDSGDLASPAIDVFNGFPLAFTQTNVGTAGLAQANALDPLLNTPFQLTANDLDTVSGTGVLGFFNGMGQVGGGPLNVAETAEGLSYLGVTYSGNSPTMSVAKIGDGAVVVTTQGTTQILGRSSGSIPFSTNRTSPLVNDSYTGFPPILESDGISAAKLAVNIVNEVVNYSQNGGGARKTGSSLLDTTAPVLARWHTAVPAGSVVSAPVEYKGISYVTVRGEIIAYDSNPGSDLDGDGDTDDGIYTQTGVLDNTLRDYSIGEPYDKIWTSGTPMVGPLSSPVCAEVPDGIGGHKDLVMVVDATGELYIYDAFKKTAQGYLEGGSYTALTGLKNVIGANDLAPEPAGVTQVPIAPTVSGDLAYIAETGGVGLNGPTGLVWVVDLSVRSWLTGANPNNKWYAGGPNAINVTLPGYTASATIGLIPIQDNSGGYDKVLYAPGVYGTNNAPGFDGLWIGAKGERPTSFEVTGGVLTITTRASGANLPIFIPNGGSSAQLALAPRVVFLDSNGDAITTSTIIGNAAPTESGGVLTFSDVTNPGAFTGANPEVTGVRVDYTIDWSASPAENAQSIERGNIKFPLPSTQQANSDRRVLGPIALTAQGTLCMIVANPTDYSTPTPVPVADPDGSIWWLRENQGRGNYNVTGRWALYPKHTVEMSPVPVQSNSVFEDADSLNQLIPTPGINAPMSGWHWSGPPSIQGNQIVVTAGAFKGGVIPVTVAMAFQADPQTPSFQASTFPVGFNLVQPDFDRSNPGTIGAPTGPDTTSTVGSNVYQYDSTSGVVQIPSLASVTKGQLTDCLSTSQPIIIRGVGGADTLLQPETIGGTWGPLNWYCVYNGTLAEGRSLITGNTMFFAGRSLLPAILTDTLTIPPVYNAVINAMDVNIPAGDPYMISPADRGWQHQVQQAIVNGGVFKSADPHIKMPSSVNVGSFSDYQTRLVQETLQGSAVADGVIGGGPNITAWGDNGIYGMSRADFLICDQGRYVRADSNGNILFSSNANLNTGPGGGSTLGNVKPMVRPTRAYPLSNNETLVVDPGANRVVKVDGSGAELRSIDHFIVAQDFQPAGYVANESPRFSAPQDALTYSNYVYSAAGKTFANQNSVEYWVHYLVADTGNHRLVELIDRFTVNANGRVGAIVTTNMATPGINPVQGQPIPTSAVPQIGVLLWQSPASVSGKNFAYNSVTRVFVWTTTDSGHYDYVAGIGNTMPVRADSGLDTANNLSLRESSTGNGGVVVYDPSVPNGISVFNLFDMPDLTNTPFWNVSEGKFDTNTSLNQKALSGVPMGGLRSVSARGILNNGNGALALMITTSRGAFEFYIDPTVPNTTGDLGSPDWFVLDDAYTQIRGGGSLSNPQQLNAAYAKRLDSGDVLLVNSYNGLYTGDQRSFNGEVIVLNGTIDASNSVVNNGEFALDKANLGFTIRSLLFNLPQGSSTGPRPITAPIFADRR